ncbi:GNAT family N-acetyltransferase [Virgibacillus sp. SK37]|uniref:GNAT family N-acetyltransferase n=1 Tax=Virgibacillus sp. SK37 TaxID=403957 RepID=UPI0004D1C65D|nr:GNAT family N-acetyltransferase [Virgibacillus sp. SK37]AIF42485.1 acetyltransferase [Virgibacillus sp. SK37]
MEIKQGNHTFFIGEEDNPLAEISFIPGEGNEIIVDHTVVSEELQGQGVAGQLVERLVQYAREEGLKIKPLCSYAQKKLENTPEYQDVLI